MSKIELPNVAGGYNLARINDNFQKIEDALNQEVLYRTSYVGEPNAMQTNLDMNGKEILNVSVGSSPGSLATKGYVDQEIAEERTYADQELAKKYDKTGGPVSGNILMQGNRISGLPNGSQPSEPATYAQLLQVEAPGDSLLRNELAAPGGAGLVGFLQYGEGVVTRTAQDKMRETVSVKDFGAKGDNATDDTQAFFYAIAYCVANRKTVYVPIGKYRTSSELEFSDDVSIICEPGVVFQNTNTSNKTFPCITISGGAKRAVLGTIDGYKEGIVVKRNTKNILFNVISNCTSGVVLRAESVGGTNLSTLDSIITGTQIGLCENGIVFEQNARLTQQGNEVHVNFCSGTKHCVVWDDLGTHTQSSNWDSNFVEFQAIDPFHIPGASICYNKTSYSVLANTVNVVKWAGGWTDATEMSLLRGGNFDACEFNFSLAQSLTPDMVCEPPQRASFGNCQARSTRHGNTATASPPVCVDQANIATFNGGVPLHQGVFKVRVSAPELAPGAQYIAYFTHAFCVSANSSKFAVRQVRAGGNGVFVQLRDSASTALGAVRVIVVNPTGTTMTSGNIDIVITCVG